MFRRAFVHAQRARRREMQCDTTQRAPTGPPGDRLRGREVISYRCRSPAPLHRGATRFAESGAPSVAATRGAVHDARATAFRGALPLARLDSRMRIRRFAAFARSRYARFSESVSFCCDMTFSETGCLGLPNLFRKTGVFASEIYPRNRRNLRVLSRRMILKKSRNVPRNVPREHAATRRHRKNAVGHRSMKWIRFRARHELWKWSFCACGQ
jgi:hypothetical protein